MGNQLLALSLGLVGIYAVVLFLYKAFNSALLMQFAIRIGFVALVFAVFLLYLTIQVLIYSSFVIKSFSLRFIIFLGLACVISGFMIFSDWLYVEDNDISTLDYQDAVFYGFAGYIGMMIIGSMVNLYVSGIKKSSLESKRKMWFFFCGLVFMLLGLITEGLGGLFEGMAVLFDILLFLCLSIGIVLMARAFL